MGAQISFLTFAFLVGYLHSPHRLEDVRVHSDELASLGPAARRRMSVRHIAACDASLQQEWRCRNPGPGQRSWRKGLRFLSCAIWQPSTSAGLSPGSSEESYLLLCETRSACSGRRHSCRAICHRLSGWRSRLLAGGGTALPIDREPPGHAERRSTRQSTVREGVHPPR